MSLPQRVLKHLLVYKTENMFSIVLVKQLLLEAQNLKVEDLLARKRISMVPDRWKASRTSKKWTCLITRWGYLVASLNTFESHAEVNRARCVCKCFACLFYVWCLVVVMSLACVLWGLEPLADLRSLLALCAHGARFAWQPEKKATSVFFQCPHMEGSIRI